MVAVAPSVLAADFARLGDEVRVVEGAGADRIHVDVMDGHFVPNLSMGPVVVKALKPVTRLPLEVHLMVREPGKFVDAFAQAGAATIIFHLEVVPDPRELINHCRRLGVRVGLAFNPDFSVAQVGPHLAGVDLALCMTVFPGFGGQPFIPESVGRVRELAGLIRRHHPACELEVDGGIDLTTAADVVGAGATVLVAGTAVFGAPEGSAEAVRKLRALGSA